MPVEFPAFDLDSISEDIKSDLEIIESETLNEPIEKTNPFINKPSKKKVFKPPTPSEQEDLNVKVKVEDKQAEHIKPKLKPKRALSEKQKAHLEKMRLKKANNKLDKIKENIISNDTINNEFQEPTEEEILDMEKSEFDSWLKNMDKFEKILQKMEQKKLKEQALKEKHEKEQEQKYFKKFQEQQKLKQQQQQTPKPQIAKPLPQLDPLKQKQNDYYDSFFTF
jgi:hypothetical protein